MTPRACQYKKQGFTLLEMIVVLGIIVGLSTAVYSAVYGYAHKQKEQMQIVADVDQIIRAATGYVAEQRGAGAPAPVITLGYLLTTGHLTESSLRLACYPHSYDPCPENAFGAGYHIERFTPSTKTPYGTLFVIFPFDNDAEVKPILHEIRTKLTAEAKLPVAARNPVRMNSFTQRNGTHRRTVITINFKI